MPSLVSVIARLGTRSSCAGQRAIQAFPAFCPPRASAITCERVERMVQATPVSISRRISSTRQAVVRGPSLIGLGNRPSLTPAHHVDLLTGIGPAGARIFLSRTQPVSGRVVWCATECLHPIANEDVVSCSMSLVAEFGYPMSEFGFDGSRSRQLGGSCSAAVARWLRIVSSEIGRPIRSKSR